MPTYTGSSLVLLGVHPPTPTPNALGCRCCSSAADGGPCSGYNIAEEAPDRPPPASTPSAPNAFARCTYQPSLNAATEEARGHAPPPASTPFASNPFRRCTYQPSPNAATGLHATGQAQAGRGGSGGSSSGLGPQRLSGPSSSSGEATALQV